MQQWFRCAPEAMQFSAAILQELGQPWLYRLDLYNSFNGFPVECFPFTTFQDISLAAKVLSQEPLQLRPCSGKKSAPEEQICANATVALNILNTVILHDSEAVCHITWFGFDIHVNRKYVFLITKLTKKWELSPSWLKSNCPVELRIRFALPLGTTSKSFC